MKFPFDKSVDTVALLSDIGKDILSVLDPKIYSPSISKGSKELIVYPWTPALTPINLILLNK